ncbi:sigma-70 family RNA polymerase sigma factor [Bacillus sp. FJAT-50079]|uniref:RNA polymerase sigma factor n=1 Tax=Bacillus sp. FJAT-50079 TaxID=2833577 RepID=UPI001BC9F3EA|nr:sigma-70 family RNA polymerase sigma factor [Bacillus sp. FJAT-50079]MBS4209563.1 sigma-70 family RNA polymerase sigma factor [Bacillus sp. FJAT-50079]
MDEALIDKILQGNDHAFRLLVEKYRNTVFYSTYGVLRNEKDAEDAAQEVFMKIYTSLPKYEKQGLKTWITRIAVNHAIDIKRKKIRRKEDEQIEYEEFHAEPTASTEWLIIKKEKQQILRDKIEELPENYRGVVKGFYFQDKTFKELAEEENVLPKSIEVKLYRARQWMKKHWKEDDFS